MKNFIIITSALLCTACASISNYVEPAAGPMARIRTENLDSNDRGVVLGLQYEDCGISFSSDCRNKPVSRYKDDAFNVAADDRPVRFSAYWTVDKRNTCVFDQIYRFQENNHYVFKYSVPDEGSFLNPPQCFGQFVNETNSAQMPVEVKPEDCRVYAFCK